jgi:hypothetical protein
MKMLVTCSVVLFVASFESGCSKSQTESALEGGAERNAESFKLQDIATDESDPLNRPDSEPSIAVNPVAPNEIAVVAFSGNWGPDRMAPIWKSRDGGQTWKKILQLPQPRADLRGPGDQKIAFDWSGKLFVTELGSDDRTAYDFIYKQENADPDKPLKPGRLYGDDQPLVEASQRQGSNCSNSTYSVWLKTGLDRSMNSVSIDGGNNVVDAAVGDSGYKNRTTRVAIASDGKVFSVYKTREGKASPEGFEPVHFLVKRSDDCGRTWEGLGKQGGISVHGVDPVMTLYTDNFGNPMKGKVGRARSSDCWIAIDLSTNAVFVAYVRKDASGLAQIYVARSLDMGKSWNSSRITDGKHHSAYPEIAVTQNSRVGVLYVDYDDSGQSNIFRHQFAMSNDRGSSWSNQVLQSMDPNVLANAQSGYLWGDYEGLTSSGDSFFGVFTGESIGRSVRQLDPIFFRIK